MQSENQKTIDKIVPPVVAIITLAQCQTDGSFEKMVNSVWGTKEAARSELKKIQKNYNSGDKHQENWRARTPIGQIDDLSVEFYNGSFYECLMFYSILEKEVK